MTTIRWGTVVLIIVGVALLTPALVHLIKLVIL